MTRATRLPALLLLAGLTACGTTVPLAQQSALGGGDQGLGLPSSAPTSTQSGADGLTAPGTTGSSALPGSRGAATAPRTGASARPVLPTSLPTGVTKTDPIVVGFTYVGDASAGFNAIGVSGTLGDGLAYSKIVVNDVNKHGGLGGRQIKPVFFAYDVNPGAATYPEQDAQACATFTQDNHVELAIVNYAGSGLTECLRKKGVPHVTEGSGGGYTEDTLRKDPLLLPLAAFSFDRRAPEEVRLLGTQGYFAKWNTTTGAPGGVQKTKVGVITYDLNDYRSSVNGPLTAALRKAGYGSPDVITVAAHDSYGNLTSMSGQLASAVLKFKAAGVTHVIIWDDNGVATLFFLTAAETQGYRPRYGINSGNNMQVVAKLVNKAQLTGATGIGWIPTLDVAAAEKANGPYGNASRRSCDARMKTGGQSGEKYNALVAATYCVAMDAIKRAYDTLKAPSPAAFVAAVEAFGSTFPSALTPSIYLSPTRHDGNGGIYQYVYDGGCGCMAYKGGVIPLLR